MGLLGVSDWKCLSTPRFDIVHCIWANANEHIAKNTRAPLSKKISLNQNSNIHSKISRIHSQVYILRTQDIKIDEIRTKYDKLFKIPYKLPY